MPKLRFDPNTVKSISPQEVEIVAGLRLTDVCDRHNQAASQNQHWLLFEAPGYDDIADTICLLSYDPSQSPPKQPRNIAESLDQPVRAQGEGIITVARIMGKAKEKWREAIKNAAYGETITFPDQCGCAGVKMNEGEIASIINGKMFACEYASGHLVDER